MDLNIEQAKAIIEAFGPCTTVYECMEAKELVEQAKEEEDIDSLLTGLLESEGLYLEQRGNQWSGEDEEQFKKDVAGDKAFLKEVAKRVKAYRASL